MTQENQTMEQNQNNSKPYVVLAVNPGHNGSAAVTINGDLAYYCEEERLSRMKYDGNPYRAMLQILAATPVDEIVVGGTVAQLPQLQWTGEDPYSALARKFNPGIKVTYMMSEHHIGHAASAFYGSGFTSAVAVIIDGSGSHKVFNIDDKNQTAGYETESIYKCSYPNGFEPVYKRYSDGINTRFDDGINEIDPSVTVTKAYEAVTEYLGFGFIEAGKTMGLSPYGKDDPDVPMFFINGKGNKNLLIPKYPMGAIIDESRYPYLQRKQDPKNWHNDFSMVTEQDKNMAYNIQKEAEEYVIQLIQKAIDLTGEKNVVLSGGFALNCVANYKFVKHFPDINFYVDPIAHDGGTSVGLSKLAWHSISGDTTIRPLKSLYLSAPPDYNIMPGLEEQLKDVVEISDITTDEIADLIIAGNIVTMYQGRSEAGPRALGNRSILFDPRNPDGKDIVNSVKMREWFRPFAGSMLAEHASDWFEMETLKESPFMMYAINAKADKVDQIPAITHVDGTCRIQTVTTEDNPGYYNLIDSFYKKTGVPILFNTSLNLAGDPLAETIFDAINILLRSKIEYLYLPDINKLVKKVLKVSPEHNHDDHTGHNH